MGTAVVRSPELEDAIRRRAEKLYEARGRAPGHEVEDWLQAEAEVIRETELAAAGRSAFVVLRFDGVTYTAEYNARCCDGYTPGEFRKGAPLEIRFDSDSMFLKRPNGKELETKIVKKEADR